MTNQEISKEERSYYRKRLGWNIVQLFVGTILLLVAYFHLQENMAEKMSISSGVEVLSQKAQLWFHNVFNKDGGVYQEKLSMEKNYAEVLNVVENSSCKEKVDAPMLSAKYSELQKESVESYAKKSSIYNQYLIEFYRKVSDVCKQEVHTQQ